MTRTSVKTTVAVGHVICSVLSVGQLDLYYCTCKTFEVHCIKMSTDLCPPYAPFFGFAGVASAVCCSMLSSSRFADHVCGSHRWSSAVCPVETKPVGFALLNIIYSYRCGIWDGQVWNRYRWVGHIQTRVDHEGAPRFLQCQDSHDGSTVPSASGHVWYHSSIRTRSVGAHFRVM